MIWNMRLDAGTKALWEAQAELEGIPVAEFVRRVVGSSCGVPACHRAVANAILKGVLVRPTKCEECASECKPEAAHSDYRRPLDVRWLCVKCHRAWDKAEPKMGTASQVSYLLNCSEEQKDSWMAAAADAGYSLAEWIRVALNDRANVGRVDTHHETAERSPVQTVRPTLPGSAAGRPFRPDPKPSGRKR